MTLVALGRGLGVTTDFTDVTDLGERLTRVRRTYGERIDLPNLGKAAFATLLGVSAITYEACERGDQVPTAELLAALYSKTGISLG